MYEHTEIDGKRCFTLIGLRDRLNAIIAENEKSGRGDRNHKPVVIATKRPRGRGGPVARFFAPEFVGSSLLRFWGHDATAIEVTEAFGEHDGDEIIDRMR